MVFTPASLDDSLLNRSAPPGSMRFFSLLYTAPQSRTALTALYVIDAEIRESAQSINHDVAHTRLQWWRMEIDRLVAGNPQHPATQLLHAHAASARQVFTELHELIAAADMDLARLTYLNTAELRAYCSRSGGAITAVAAAALCESAPDASTRSVANRIGLAVRLSEIIRDARAEAFAGRLYAPLDAMDQHGVKLENFVAKEYGAAAKAVLRGMHDTALQEFAGIMTDIPPASRAYLRPLLVLAALHRQLLKRIAGSDFNVATARIDLGPVEKPWTAWRAARKAR